MMIRDFFSQKQFQQLKDSIKRIEYNELLEKVKHIDKPRSSTTYDLPPKLHFIWIGSQIPNKYIHNLLSYYQHNYKNYQLYWWTDSHNQNINLEGITKKNVNQLTLINHKEFQQTPNYGRKADILRYEIIYQFGGIYCDVDSVALKPFDHHFRKSFVVFNQQNLAIANEVFGLPAKSDFLLFLIKCVPQTMPKIGPRLFKLTYLLFDDLNIEYIDAKFLTHAKFLTGSEKKFGYSHHTYDGNWLRQPGSH